MYSGWHRERSLLPLTWGALSLHLVVLLCSGDDGRSSETLDCFVARDQFVACCCNSLQDCYIPNDDLRERCCHRLRSECPAELAKSSDENADFTEAREQHPEIPAAFMWSGTGGDGGGDDVPWTCGRLMLLRTDLSPDCAGALGTCTSEPLCGDRDGCRLTARRLSSGEWGYTSTWSLFNGANVWLLPRCGAWWLATTAQRRETLAPVNLSTLDSPPPAVEDLPLGPPLLRGSSGACDTFRWPLAAGGGAQNASGRPKCPQDVLQGSWHVLGSHVLGASVEVLPGPLHRRLNGESFVVIEAVVPPTYARQIADDMATHLQRFGNRNMTLVSDTFLLNRRLIPRGRWFRQVSHITSTAKEWLRYSDFLVVLRFDKDIGAAVSQIQAAGGRIHRFPHADPHIADSALWEIGRQEMLGIPEPARAMRFATHNWPVWVTLHTGSKLGLSYFNFNRHETICEVIEWTRHVRGAYVEVGVFGGGSAATALMYMRAAKIQRPVGLFDTFEGFNYEHAKLDVGSFGSHLIYSTPAAWMEHLNMHVLGPIGVPYVMHPLEIIEHPLPDWITEIAVAHIDVDIYPTTLAALVKIAPLVQAGGYIILDDVDCIAAAWAALHTFLRMPIGYSFRQMSTRGQMVLVRFTA